MEFRLRYLSEQCLGACWKPARTPSARGAVIANAIYDAAGARLLQLPTTPARIQQALKRG